MNDFITDIWLNEFYITTAKTYNTNPIFMKNTQFLFNYSTK